MFENIVYIFFININKINDKEIRINIPSKAVANQMSDLSSDEDDFEPSAFHRNIRQQGQNFAYPVYDPNNETGEFSSFEKSNSPITYQSKIPKPVHPNMSPRRDSSPKKTESSAEMKEITQCYHAAQRRIQDLERQVQYFNR